MLIEFARVAASLWTLSIVVGAVGNSVALDAPGALSGSAVHAISDVYAAAKQNGDLNDASLPGITVSVAGGSTSTIVLSKDGKPYARYSYAESQPLARQTLSADGHQLAGAVELSGLATKALATAYMAWKADTVPVLSKTDLDADQFKVAYHEFISTRTHGPVYWITYYPAVDQHVMTGCLVQQNYGVDINSWRVIVEGTIC